MWTGALVFAWFAIAWCIAQKRPLPPIVLLPALTHFIWFVPGAGLKSFWVVIPLFHSLQYLLIALVMQFKLRTDVECAGRSWHDAATSSALMTNIAELSDPGATERAHPKIVEA